MSGAPLHAAGAEAGLCRGGAGGTPPQALARTALSRDGRAHGMHLLTASGGPYLQRTHPILNCFGLENLLSAWVESLEPELAASHTRAGSSRGFCLVPMSHSSSSLLLRWDGSQIPRTQNRIQCLGRAGQGREGQSREGRGRAGRVGMGRAGRPCGSSCVLTSGVHRSRVSAPQLQAKTRSDAIWAIIT